MFSNFDGSLSSNVAPLHAETVGARKARKAKANETATRSSSTASRSSGSTGGREARGSEKSSFGWFGKSSKKGVQEISVLPTIKKAQVATESIPHQAPELSVARSNGPPNLRRESSQEIEHNLPTQRVPPPLKSLPTPPSSGAFPLPPSPGLLSLPGTCVVSETCKDCVTAFCIPRIIRTAFVNELEHHVTCLRSIHRYRKKIPLFDLLSYLV